MCEARTYPHDKLCGEFLSPECEGLLCHLGFGERLSELQPAQIDRVTLTAPDGNAWESALPGHALGISRKTLDAELANLARQTGVKVHEASRVTGLTGDLKQGFELEVRGPAHTTTVYTRAVVGAHGRRDAFDRLLGRRFLKQRQPFIAVQAHYQGPPIPGRIELHAFPGGYCGLSEIEGGQKVVCFLAHEQVFHQARGQGRASIEGFVEWMKTQNLFLRSWMQWADRTHEHWLSISQVPFTSKPAVERDVVMVGDAAGAITPLAGNGIAMALEGGILAAGALARFLEGEIGSSDLRRGYGEIWNRRFGRRLRLGRLLQPILMHPKAASLALRVFNKFPSLGQFLITSTRSPYQAELKAKAALPELWTPGDAVQSEKHNEV